MRRGRLSVFLLVITMIIAGLLYIPDYLLDIESDLLSGIDIPLLGLQRKYTDEEAYNIILDALIDLEDQVKLSSNLTSDQVFDIRDRVIQDHPEIFYLDYEETTYWSNGKLELGYIDSKEKIIEKRQKIELKSNYILSKIIEPEMTEYQKELAIHDYIVLNTRYDNENYEKNTIPISSYNVDGVLLEGVGVCEGYALTFKMLLEKVGIESVVVLAPQINHAWNIVKIDGEHYHVDVTWNDPVPDRQGRVLYTYFNLSDRKMLQGQHRWDQNKYPACTSEKYQIKY